MSEFFDCIYWNWSRLLHTLVLIVLLVNLAKAPYRGVLPCISFGTCTRVFDKKFSLDQIVSSQLWLSHACNVFTTAPTTFKLVTFLCFSANILHCINNIGLCYFTVVLKWPKSYHNAGPHYQHLALHRTPSCTIILVCHRTLSKTLTCTCKYISVRYLN